MNEEEQETLEQSLNQDEFFQNMNSLLSVTTDFEKRANVKFNIFARAPSFVAKKAYKGLLKGRLTIVPGFEMKCLHFLSHLFPKRLITVFLKSSATIVTDLK